MPRRKPNSAKQKKELLQQKRAIKRGDVEPPPPATSHTDRKGRRHAPPQLADGTHRNTAAVESSRKLQSAFVKLPKPFLEETKRLSASIALQRPIPSDVAVWRDIDAPEAHPDGDTKSPQLTCPKRPKWRYDMTKKEVEKNEEGLFKKWIDQTDGLVNTWCDPAAISAKDKPESEGIEAMPHAPTSFERNLEVWRQLWRVTEISQILLVLLDSRCPLLHYPPSLEAYLAAPHLARKRTILVLTKVDIAGPARADAWTRYLQHRFPGLRVVQVESYAEKTTAEASGARKAYEPHLPSAFRQTLVDALRDTHAELLELPERIRDVPEKAAAWKPPVKREVDWEAVLHARGGKVGHAVGGVAVPRPSDAVSGDPSEPVSMKEGPEEDEDDDVEPEFLTIGLIGQPNVGKSSLLNALFGISKVRASKTPGKTKHFQTLFWTSEVRLVDCPGLVMPNLVPMETQVLCGILPISRVSAVPLCIYHAAQLLPLERILALTHPAAGAAPAADKRTWRAPRTPAQQAQEQERARAPVWTAMDVLTAYALKKGWLTAKAGRPDINRAGNAILRMLAEGRIRWAFWPPGTPATDVEAHHDPGSGIWIPHGAEDDFEDDSDSEDEPQLAPNAATSDASEEEIASASEGEDESEGSEDEELAPVSKGQSRFALLQVAAEDEDEEEEEDSDNEEEE